MESLDRCSLKYPPKSVYQSVLVMHQIFQKIDEHSHPSQIMYEGSCCQKFIRLSPIVVEETYYWNMEGMVCLL